MIGRRAFSVTEGSSGLKIDGLRKSYKKKVVIREVSMELERGEVVALLGPNGSGKTTSFYAIAGLVYPEGGTVRIDGRDVTNLPMYRVLTRSRSAISVILWQISKSAGSACSSPITTCAKRSRSSTVRIFCMTVKS